MFGIVHNRTQCATESLQAARVQAKHLYLSLASPLFLVHFHRVKYSTPVSSTGVYRGATMTKKSDREHAWFKQHISGFVKALNKKLATAQSFICARFVASVLDTLNCLHERSKRIDV
jgi:hypothetical protein